jgi:hypothetical protein
VIIAARITAILTLVLGTAAALYYAQLDLTLSHYDARGHLMVARRVFDNLMPGWMQLGAVWLPLPHLLNAVPVQWDWSYRTGASGVVLSVLPLSAGLGALGGYLAERTQSVLVAVAIPLAILLNPNVLYLQSTPMTEPLLFGLACLALVMADRWIEAPESSMRTTGVVLMLLMLTRYEGWLITGALMGLLALAHPRQAMRLAVYPAAACVGFLLLSYGSTGQWFVASGFFEATNPALGNPLLAWEQIIEAATSLSDTNLMRLGAVGGVGVLAGAVVARREGRQAIVRALLPLALLAAVALPLYAFSSGHPVRVRYMVSMVVALTVLTAFALRWLPPRIRGVAAVVFLAVMVWTVPPLDPEAPMVREAQWERPYGEARRVVTAALAERWDGTPVMASMGSLGHYMQQMSHAGFDLADFLHEGNGDLWKAAVITPAPYVRWILIEESAEGGDVLAQRSRASTDFLAGFTRVAEGGGVALYERHPE